MITEKNGQYGYTETYVTGTGYYDVTFGERFVALGGDPNILSFVNPLSFNLSNVFGRYVSYVDYEETFRTGMDVVELKVWDQLNLNLKRIALSIRTKSVNDDPKVLSSLALAFDQARFKLYSDFEDRDIFNLMTDEEGEALFMRYLNERLQAFFPSPTTFAKMNYGLLGAGDPPSSKITLIGPFYSPN